MLMKKNKSMDNFKSVWYEGTVRYVFILLFMLYLAIFPFYLIIKLIFETDKIHSYLALFLLFLLAFFCIKMFIWVFKTIFIYTSPFFATKKELVFTQFFNKKTILWSDVTNIELDSFVDIKIIIGKQHRGAIILNLKNGKQEYILKNKAYKNIDEFILFLKTNFPEKIVPRLA